jgi:tRNA nucleotidyltransferase (CCA-adding enzyme)
LHNLSFVEDPTRVFRAIRFEQRFGFSIGKLTSGLIENAVKMNFFKRLSGRRVFSELRQILEEETPLAAIKRLDEYDLLNVIHPSIELNNQMILLFNSVKKVLSWHDLLFLEEPYMKWIVYFLALTRHCDKKTNDEISIRIELAPRYKTIFCKERFEADRSILWMERNLPAKNSTIYKRLAVFRIELILYMMAATGHQRVKRSISNYVTRLRHINTSVKGKDLKKMGLEPGPIYREILQAVLDAKLNGKLKTRDDELDFVKNYVR